MRKFYFVFVALIAISSALSMTMAQDEVSVTYGVNMDSHDALQVFVLKTADDAYEVLPEADGVTYKILQNSDVRFKITPRENYVAYVWETTVNGKKEEIEQSYSSTEQVIKVTQDMDVFVDVCELIPVTFIVPEEGSRGKEVNVEEQGDFGRAIEPLEDGNTYLLPKDRGAYFDPMTDVGYNILSWNFGEEGARFPSRPDQFYKQNMPAGFYLTVSFFKDGEKRTVTYTEPQTAVLVAKNNSISGAPEIESGSQVDPGDDILFEVYPFENPSGKVDLHHWEVNGVKYMLDEKTYFTDNSLSVFADKDLDVKVVPMAEYEDETTSIDGGSIVQPLQCTYYIGKGTLAVSSNKNEPVELISLAGQTISSDMLQNGMVEIKTENLNAGIYIIRQGNESVKVYIK